MHEVWMGRRALLKAAAALCVIGTAFVIAMPAGAASNTSGTDSCGYPASSFTESTVMRWAQINGSGTSAQLAAYANDEKGLLLGVNGATDNASAPQHATNPAIGDITATDPSGRPFFPALYITNVTAHPSGNPGDFQNHGSPRNVHGSSAFVDDVFGTWSTATTSSGKYQVNPPAGKNSWDLGSGSDAPAGTDFGSMGDEGYGSEVRWNLGNLTDSDGQPLQAGSTYRIQVIEHDGDQNKTGGDAGEFCVSLKIPGTPPPPPSKPTISTSATSNTTGNPIHDTATLSGTGGGAGSITWKVYAMPTDCTGTPADTVSAQTNGDGNYTSPDYTPSSSGTYQWVATYTSGGTSVSTSCSDTNERSTVSNSPAPAIKLVKLERDGTSGQYVPGPITVKVGDTINYLMTVSNAGNTSLVLDFSDPVCGGSLSAPSVIAGSYDAASRTLSVGGQVQYTCSHLLTSGDPSPFVNTATATGTPPSGPQVSAQSSVIANKQSLRGRKVVKRCAAGKVKKVKRNKKGKKVVVCVAKKISHPPRHARGFTGSVHRA